MKVVLICEATNVETVMYMYMIDLVCKIDRGRENRHIQWCSRRVDAIACIRNCLLSPRLTSLYH